jgi:hypothetical protein
MDYLKQPIDELREDLDRLNREWMDIDDSKLSANQCYHLETDPPHFLFNLNCPETLQQKLKDILRKYFPRYENGFHHGMIL